jgi:hypothetical protein
MHVYLYIYTRYTWTYLCQKRQRLHRSIRLHPGIVYQEQKAPRIGVSERTSHIEEQDPHIFLISRLGICMQEMMSGKRATMSLLLIVMFAMIFFKAIFFAELFLSFFPPLFSSWRSSATLPCGNLLCKLLLGVESSSMLEARLLLLARGDGGAGSLASRPAPSRNDGGSELDDREKREAILS